MTYTLTTAAISASASSPPGRLGDPAMTIGADPRADRRMVRAMARIGLDSEPLNPKFGPEPSLADIRAQAAQSEAGFAVAFDILNSEPLSPVEGVESSTEVITGVDGNPISVYIHRPSRSGEDVAAAAPSRMPGILHLHGGAMVMLTADGPMYTRWRDMLASLGVIIAGVEFRNAAGALGDHPFPAALNDCTTALEWMHANRAELGISKIVVSGDSGGGNLTLATALRARQEGRLHMIDGVYVQCPYISGAYGDPPAALPSLAENDGYLLSCDMMAHMVECYDPGGSNRRNPLAWPYHASADDLRGMPPHVVSLNELDPLRDEGMAYYRGLLEAGVPAVGRTLNGTCHAGDLLFPGPMPDVCSSSARDLAGFAQGL